MSYDFWNCSNCRHTLAVAPELGSQCPHCAYRFDAADIDFGPGPDTVTWAEVKRAFRGAWSRLLAVLRGEGK